MYNHVVEVRDTPDSEWRRHTERMAAAEIVKANRQAGWNKFRLPPLGRYADQIA